MKKKWIVMAGMSLSIGLLNQANMGQKLQYVVVVVVVVVAAVY